jgi:hypothetical protein
MKKKGDIFSWFVQKFLWQPIDPCRKTSKILEFSRILSKDKEGICLNLGDPFFAGGI